VVEAYHLQRTVGVAVGDYGHGQLHPCPVVVCEEVQHDLVDRAGGGAGEDDVLHDGVALAQPLGRPFDEGA
jgi:hypothetical protein